MCQKICASYLVLTAVAAIGCGDNQAGESSQPDVRSLAESPSEEELPPAFSLDVFEEDFTEQLEQLRSLGDDELEPFSPPPDAPPSLEGIGKEELLYRGRGEVDIHGADIPGPQSVDYDIGVYAAEVAAKLGPIPSFNVLTEGKLIPITRDGVELQPGEHNSSTLCDRPALLSLGGDGQCVPYSRLGRLPGTNPTTGQPDPNIQWVFIARRYKVRTDPNHPIFEDVAIIGSHKLTGDTAFFQMLDTTNGKNATRVPSPMEAPSQTPAGQPTAVEFWLNPADAATIRCDRCHDSDPFIHTPHVNQVTRVGPSGSSVSMVPSQRRGRYQFIGSQAFSQWPTAMHFEPRSNRCTICHRIGRFGSSESLARWSTGDPPPSGISQSYGKYWRSHWMPPKDSKHMTLQQWTQRFRPSVDQLLSCSADPTQQACRLSPMQ